MYDDTLQNPGTQEPYPRGTVKRVTSVRIEEHAGVRTQEKKDAGKQSEREDQGGDCREKVRERETTGERITLTGSGAEHLRRPKE
ncbi:hypothetical protein NDU88_001868 [Pleurodeles waltl]|uniref:Uncharacterized protein n=1 Tax=Pleurodeles waltl TaxID=8319 RepID=A0AAV7T0G1_PLEWA|nr:hypothetical protein NDU88_001868 [Pleurodeles waltl]